MKKSWIFVLGVLGLATSSCSGFTVQRSNPGSFGSRNWSVPVLHLNRRNPVEKIFSNDLHSGDIENILRDPEMRQFVKMPEKKCASSSEDGQRLKRSEDLLDSTNHLPNVEKIVSELRETTIGSSNFEIKTSGLTIVTSPKELKISDTSIIASSKEELRTSGSSNVTSPKETRIPESTVVVSAKEANLSKSTIVSLPKETKIILNEAKTPDITLGKSANSQALKNVVLLLIDDSTTGRENYYKFFETARKFSVHGFLQNCYNSKLPEVAVFPLGDSLVSRKRGEECDCDHYLRANIASLLSWARHKEMTTGTISSTNFTIPLPLGYENPSNQWPKEFEDNEETNGFHQEIPRSKPESNNVWRLIEIEKQTTSNKESSPSDSVSPSVGTLSKQEGVNGFDGMWNVLDMLSRIRIAFFRILLESLGNMAGTGDEFNGKRTLPLQPSFVTMMTDAIREFKVVRNDNGFILVAAAPKNEWSEAIDILQREILTKDTLLVVSGICSPTNERAPFFAHGPGEKILKDARTIWELPELIQRVMTDGCLKKSCEKQRHEKPVALPSLESYDLPQDLPRKRVGRATLKVEVNETVLTNTISTKKPGNETKDDKVIILEIKNRSGAADVRMDNVAKVLGIATSFLTMLALKSP